MHLPGTRFLVGICAKPEGWGPGNLNTGFSLVDPPWAMQRSTIAKRQSKIWRVQRIKKYGGQAMHVRRSLHAKQQSTGAGAQLFSCPAVLAMSKTQEDYAAANPSSKRWLSPKVVP